MRSTRSHNDTSLIAEMGLALDGLFVGQGGNDGLILQLWSRSCALNVSIPLATAVLQDVRERHPGGIISTLSADRYFRIPEGSPIVAAVLDELGVDVEAQWGLQWRNGILASASFRATLSGASREDRDGRALFGENGQSPILTAALQRQAVPAPAVVPLDQERFFGLQAVIPRSEWRSDPRPADPPPPPLREVCSDGEPRSLPVMQYLFTDVPLGGLIRVEIEDTSVEAWFALEGYGCVRPFVPRDPYRPPRPDKTVLMQPGRCIALVLAGCRLTLESDGESGHLRWRSDAAGAPALQARRARFA